MNTIYDTEPLTERKRRFAEEFFDLSSRRNSDYGCAAMAYRRINPATTGNAHTINVEGHRLLADPDVQQYITELKAGTRRRKAATADRVVEELEKLAFYNPLDYFKINPVTGQLEPDNSLLDPTGAAAINSVRIEDTKYGKRVSFGFHSKNDALMQLCKILGIHRENINLTIEALDELIAKVRADIAAEADKLKAEGSA